MKNILIAEENKVMVQTIGLFFKESMLNNPIGDDFIISTAGNQHDAESIIGNCNFPINIVILDYKMGTELAKKVPENVPIVFLNGIGYELQSEDEKMFVKVLKKPFRLRELKEIVDSL